MRLRGSSKGSEVTWIIIIFALALVIGPVAYMLPSARDRRLAALRAEVLKQGGRVKLEWLPKLNAELHERVSAGGQVRDPKVECVRYALPGGKAFEHAPQLQLLRDADGAWVVDPEVSEVADPEVRALLEGSAGAFPPDTLALALIQRDLSICWLEKSPADEAVVAEIYAVLGGLKRQIADVLAGRSESSSS